MTISDPIDVDPRSPENREGALTSNPSPLPKYSPRVGADKPHKHDVAVPSKSPSPSKEPVSDDERFERPESKKDASEEPASHGAGPIQDEIVVAPLRGSRPRSDPEPGNGRPEAQVETRTPSERQFSEREVSNNTVAMPTPMTQANRKLKEETVTPAARRNPKRTASAMAQLQPASESRHEDILDATLKPLENEELGNWAGWIELESEPAFFNFILRDLGAEDVLIKEVLCLDDDLIRRLPKPIHGLIFLFQYLPEDWEVDKESDTDDVWFANQTVDNACATIAMMNILMNAPSIKLGDTLREFKETTKMMSSPLRGHAISTNMFIRKVHNSFTRRLDHLNADLCLSYKAEMASKRKKRTKGKKSKGRMSEESGYHFIAYVPVNGYVWELDGLKSRPTKLEPVTSEDWALNALPTIWSRMEEYGGGFEFNLLAMCQSPLRDLCRKIASNAHVLDLVEQRLGDLPGPAPEANGKTELPAPDKFPEYRVTPDMVSEAPVPENVRPLLSLLAAIPSATGPAAADPNATTSVPRATLHSALHSALGLEPELPPTETVTLTPADVRAYLETLAAKVRMAQDDAIARHAVEVGTLSTDLERVEGRKKDYTPAIHTWLKILAEKGVLEEIAG
ncbi:hypothetical protein VUR80DRAFT_5781 [Thermomyces stellatus]